MERHLYCLHANNGRNEIALYVRRSQGRSAGWTVYRKSMQLGEIYDTPKLDGPAKRKLEEVAALLLRKHPEEWDSGLETGPGCLVWCETQSVASAEQDAMDLHGKGLALVQFYENTERPGSRRAGRTTYWNICRMR